jgi:hypothetical protein
MVLPVVSYHVCLLCLQDEWECCTTNNCVMPKYPKTLKLVCSTYSSVFSPQNDVSEKLILQ